MVRVFAPRLMPNIRDLFVPAFGAGVVGVSWILQQFLLQAPLKMLLLRQ